VATKDIMISLLIKVEHIDKFCYLENVFVQVVEQKKHQDKRLGNWLQF